MNSFRVRLDLTNLTSIGVHLSQCWFLINPLKINSVADLRTEICHRFGLQLNHSGVKVYLQNYEVLPEESIQILRDDDILVLKYENNEDFTLRMKLDTANVVNNVRQKHVNSKTTHSASEEDNLNICSVSHRKKKKKKHEINSEMSLLNNSFDLENSEKRREKRKRKLKDIETASIKDFSVLCFGSETNQLGNTKTKKKKHKYYEDNIDSSVEHSEKKTKKNKNGETSAKTNTFNEFNSSYCDVGKTNLNTDHSQPNLVIQEAQICNVSMQSQPISENTDEAEKLCITNGHDYTEPVTNQKKRKRKRKRKNINQVNSFSNNEKTTESFATPPSFPIVNFKNKIFTRNKHIHFDTDKEDKTPVLKSDIINNDKVESDINSQEQENTALPCDKRPEVTVDECGANEKELVRVENTKEIEEKKDKQQEKINYSVLADLLHPPRVGDVIAFKELVLSEAYSPEVSDYKEGKVVGYDESSGLLEIELTKELVQPVKTGKFEIESLDENGVNTIKKVYRQFSALIEPKIVSLATTVS